MHFRSGPACPRSPLPTLLHFGDLYLEFTEQYKYLGVVLHEFGDVKEATKLIAASAHRALGALIAKFKNAGGMSYGLYTHLYNALVSPVLDYGSGVWGHKQFSPLNAVEHRAQRFFLHVPSKTTNLAVQGEMGWVPCHDRHILNIVRLWLRLLSMSDDRITRRVFLWDLNLAKKGRKNWCWHTMKELRSLGFVELAESCNFDGDPHAILEQTKTQLKARTNRQWTTDLFNDSRNRGDDGNKLRTYRRFKTERACEPYLNRISNDKHRKILSRLRCGTHDLRIETGRYCVPKKPAGERFCPCCQTGSETRAIEDEQHFVMECSLYADIRFKMLTFCDNEIRQFPTLSQNQQFELIMSSPPLAKQCSAYLWEMYDRRSMFLYS